MEQKMIRYKQRLANYSECLKHLNDAFAIEHPSNLEKAGIIQLFELVFELGWKTIKDFLESKGLVENSPRDVLKQAFKTGIISRGEDWLLALTDRNNTTHIYDKAELDKILDNVRSTYVHIFNELQVHLDTQEM